MGHIRKQTIYSSAIIYFGFIIGAFNLLILFPRLVGPEYLGLTKVIQDYAVILTSLAGLGFGSPFSRFSPYYNAYSKKGSNDDRNKRFAAQPAKEVIIHRDLYSFVVETDFIIDGPAYVHGRMKHPAQSAV